MNKLNDYFHFKNFIVRDATENDISTLVSIINEAYLYLEEFRKKPRTSEIDLLEKFQENDFKLIFNKNDIAGCFCINIHDSNMYFGMFALDPVYRGTGLGKEILKTIELYAKTMKIKVIEIDRMSVSPWLKKYYEDQGFIETGVVEKWGEIDRIQMHKQIY